VQNRKSLQVEQLVKNKLTPKSLNLLANNDPKVLALTKQLDGLLISKKAVADNEVAVNIFDNLIGLKQAEINRLKEQLKVDIAADYKRRGL